MGLIISFRAIKIDESKRKLFLRMRIRDTTVIQSMELWLPLTANWIYSHLKHMEHVLSIVMARRLVEPDKFPWHPLYAPNVLGQTYYRFAKKLGYRWYPQAYAKAIQLYSPQILHSHFGNMGWYDLPFADKHRLKHIVTFYGFDVNMLPLQDHVWQKRYRELFARADLFLCEGPYMASSLVDLGCPEDKVKVQRLGVVLEQIAYVPRKLSVDGPLRILIAGSFREKKGIPYALEAIGQLRKDGIDVQVTIIGDSRGLKREEMEKRKIQNILDKYDLHAATRLLGYQPHARMISEAYQHHVFLSPSVTALDGDTEGGAPISIIEMAASGMPVVSTRHCDIPQVILDGRTGWLADERDVDGLVRHLRWLYDNPERWRIFTDKGRKHIETHFDVRVQAALLGEIYRGLVDSS